MLHVVTPRLYVVHGSHPCAAVERALELKGISYDVTEWPPPMQVPLQRLLFGASTVPGLQLDGERISGSRAIMHRLDALAPEPALYPSDPELRTRVEEADEWGDEVFQGVARRLIWIALARDPAAAPSYSVGSRLPLPDPLIRLSAPLISRVEISLHDATDDAVRADLLALPGHLDLVDGGIGAGSLGGPQPNAADFQIGSTVRLLLTLADLRPLIEGRPAAELARRHFPDWPGEVPAGTLPADWIPAR